MTSTSPDETLGAGRIATSRTDRDRRRRHTIDFLRAAVWAQFRVEFDQYFLGWLWWILEPITYALTFFFIVSLFFHLEGNRLWVILLSVVVWRWFSRSVDASPHLARQFAPYTRSGAVTTQLLFVTFLAKETVVFFIALSVIMLPVAIFASPLSLHLLELPLVLLAQGLLIYWVSAAALIAGAAIHDIGKVVGLLVSIWFYFSPGIYLRADLSGAPQWVTNILTLNPFWAILTSWQNILVLGRAPDHLGLFVWIGISAVMCVLLTTLLTRSRRLLARVAIE